VTNPASNIPTLSQNITYTPYFQPAMISEGTNILSYIYGNDQQRIKGTLVQNGVTTNIRYYLGGYEKDITNGVVRHIHYISNGQNLIAMIVRENGTDSYYYIYTDHIGSILTVSNENGSIAAEQNFDAWGRKRNVSNWTYNAIPTVPSWLYRGFTGHENLSQFLLINMNGRIYDPIVGRMLSPDNNLQMPDFTQNYNRYSYALNNPLRFTDPDGESITGAVVVGAIIGAYLGGMMANRDYNPINWDYNSGKTWGYMLGGALVGAGSGYIGGAVAASGMPFANTAGIASSSFVNSVGTSIYTNGQTDVNISLGFASYNFSKNKWGYLGKQGNSNIENIGYGFGALANLQDIVAWNQGKDIEVLARKEIAGHSEIRGDNGNISISVGPKKGAIDFKSETTNDIKWESQYLRHSVGAENSQYIATNDSRFTTNLSNVNSCRLFKMTGNLNGGHNLLGFGSFKYGILRGCVNYTSRALLYAGVPTINAFLPITTPVSLNFELAARQIGIYSSPFFVR
jgi:RHS repeat-associated protein